jgi:thymidylate synthase ThyX
LTQPQSQYRPTEVAGAIPVESFTSQETEFLRNYVTNVDKPVFALINLPEVVKGALFARYSRSRKSLRRLLLDEFRGDVAAPAEPRPPGQSRSNSLYNRVFAEYGDDSIAQLGGVHVACEGVSNIATKLIERGRLMSYLEQSTRYIAYTDRPGGHWRYHTPAEFVGPLRQRYQRDIDAWFEAYCALIPQVEGFLRDNMFREGPLDQGPAFARAVRAKTLDVLRGLLPASTRSNLGIFGSGQAYESLIMRLRASGNAEAAGFADQLLAELEMVAPAFVARVDRPDRGLVWTEYLSQTRAGAKAVADAALAGQVPEAAPSVSLVDFDPDGEIKVVAAALYAHSNLPDSQLLRIAADMTPSERAQILKAYLGNRSNRRHRPGRAFERTGYRFDVLADYGAFRDLQRHRMLTLDWQPLTVGHGYCTPEMAGPAGITAEWDAAMEQGADLFEAIRSEHPVDLAGYGVPMAYKIRYFMDMNAREAMHVIELRSAPQGHDAYRRIAVQMHSLIAEQAGHTAIAEAMRFVSREDVGGLGRLEAELRRQGGSEA